MTPADYETHRESGEHRWRSTAPQKTGEKRSWLVFPIPSGSGGHGAPRAGARAAGRAV